MLAILSLTLFVQTKKPVAPILEINRGKINVTLEGKTQSFSVNENPSEEVPIKFVSFRRNDNWAVWDDRGLTVRAGAKAFSTKLGDYAVSPKLFAREDIIKNLDLFKVNKRTKDCDALSGSMRIGTKCYFLPRWTSSAGDTWLEALVEVDLGDANPKPKLIGKFGGLTSSFRPIDDKLFLVKDDLAVVSTNGETWGLSTFDDRKEEFAFSPLGSNLVSYFRGGFFLESTSYATYIVGQIDLASGLRKNLFETRSKQVDLRDGSSVAVIREGKKVTLRNLRTGAQMNINSTAYVTPVDKYVLVWTRENRTTAWLYEPTRWSAISTAATN